MPEERRIPVTVVRVYLYCDCGGVMGFTGECLASNPPKYPHTCDNCGKHWNVRGHTYPKTEYEAIT